MTLNPSTVSPRLQINFHTPLSGVNVPLGGRLYHFHQNWAMITNDPYILEIVKGYKLDFIETPFQQKPPKPLSFSKSETALLDAEICELRAKNAVRVVHPTHGQFISTLFAVPKKDGGNRPVINLKEVNQFLSYRHFKMEGIHSLRDLLRPNDWLGKIDLKDAYFVVPIWENHQKFLRFLWKGSLMEFACLPFGLASAPRIFTKLMKPVVALLRRSGIRLIIYLDDILFMNQTPMALRRDISTALHLLENLGFIINMTKSQLDPTQTLEFLGFLVNTRDMTLVLPQGKVTNIKNLCTQMMALKVVTVRDVARLIGKLTASIQAIFPAPLHYRQLQSLKNQALQSGGTYDTQISLNPACREELLWWVAHLDAWNGRAIFTPQPDLVIETDASKQGWGAICQDTRTGGLWSQSERLLHINCLELLAGAFAVKCFTRNQICLHVRLKMDNTTAIAYINKLGGTHSLVLSNLVADLWIWALNRGMILSAEHLPGKWNVLADLESRQYRDSSDWRLEPSLFRALMTIRGPCQIDLFANRLNTQLPDFFSWRPDPQGLASDAFQQMWNTGRHYAFPPFCLIMKTLAKLREEGGNLLLITPVWPTQPWYPVLLDMSIAPPVLLPQTPNLLTSPVGDIHPLIQNKSLFLAAWHVSNDLPQQEAYQTGLPNSFWHLGDQAQMQYTIQPGLNGVAGVRRGKLIHFAPLWEI